MGRPKGKAAGIKKGKRQAKNENETCEENEEPKKKRASKTSTNKEMEPKKNFNKNNFNTEMSVPSAPSQSFPMSQTTGGKFIPVFSKKKTTLKPCSIQGTEKHGEEKPMELDDVGCTVSDLLDANIATAETSAHALDSETSIADHGKHEDSIKSDTVSSLLSPLMTDAVPSKSSVADHEILTVDMAQPMDSQTTVTKDKSTEDETKTMDSETSINRPTDHEILTEDESTVDNTKIYETDKTPLLQENNAVLEGWPNVLNQPVEAMVPMLAMGSSQSDPVGGVELEGTSDVVKSELHTSNNETSSLLGDSEPPILSQVSDTHNTTLVPTSTQGYTVMTEAHKICLEGTNFKKVTDEIMGQVECRVNNREVQATEVVGEFQMDLTGADTVSKEIENLLQKSQKNVNVVKSHMNDDDGNMKRIQENIDMLDVVEDILNKSIGDRCDCAAKSKERVREVVEDHEKILGLLQSSDMQVPKTHLHSQDSSGSAKDISDHTDNEQLSCPSAVGPGDAVDEHVGFRSSETAQVKPDVIESTLPKIVPESENGGARHKKDWDDVSKAHITVSDILPLESAQQEMDKEPMGQVDDSKAERFVVKIGGREVTTLKDSDSSEVGNAVTNSPREQTLSIKGHGLDREVKSTTNPIVLGTESIKDDEDQLRQVGDKHRTIETDNVSSDEEFRNDVVESVLKMMDEETGNDAVRTAIGGDCDAVETISMIGVKNETGDVENGHDVVDGMDDVVLNTPSPSKGPAKFGTKYQGKCGIGDNCTYVKSCASSKMVKVVDAAGKRGVTSEGPAVDVSVNDCGEGKLQLTEDNDMEKIPLGENSEAHEEKDFDVDMEDQDQGHPVQDKKVSRNNSLVSVKGFGHSRQEVKSQSDKAILRQCVVEMQTVTAIKEDDLMMGLSDSQLMDFEDQAIEEQRSIPPPRPTSAAPKCRIQPQKTEGTAKVKQLTKELSELNIMMVKAKREMEHFIQQHKQVCNQGQSSSRNSSNWQGNRNQRF